MAVTDTQFQMLIDLVRETRDDVKAIREDYARANDLKSCRAHCDSITSEVFERLGSLDQHKACLSGAEKARKEEQEQEERKRKEQQEREDLEAQRGMRTNIIVGAIIGGIFLLLATIGGIAIGKLWP